MKASSHLGTVVVKTRVTSTPGVEMRMDFYKEPSAEGGVRVHLNTFARPRGVSGPEVWADASDLRAMAEKVLSILDGKTRAVTKDDLDRLLDAAVDDEAIAIEDFKRLVKAMAGVRVGDPMPLDLTHLDGSDGAAAVEIVAVALDYYGIE